MQQYDPATTIAQRDNGDIDAVRIVRLHLMLLPRRMLSFRRAMRIAEGARAADNYADSSRTGDDIALEVIKRDVVSD